MTDKPLSTRDTIGCFLLACFLLLISGVYIYSEYVAHHFSATPEDELKYAAARTNLNMAAIGAFGSIQLRMDQRRGGSVYLYLPEREFENVPFPDREQTLNSLASIYCTTPPVEGSSHISLRDIRTGEQFASKSCGSFKKRR